MRIDIYVYVIIYIYMCVLHVVQANKLGSSLGGGRLQNGRVPTAPRPLEVQMGGFNSQTYICKHYALWAAIVWGFTYPDSGWGGALPFGGGVLLHKKSLGPAKVRDLKIAKLGFHPHAKPTCPGGGSLNCRPMNQGLSRYRVRSMAKRKGS